MFENTRMRRLLFKQKRAAEMVEPGDVIYVDSGTTCSCMFSYLSSKDIIIVTSNYEILDYMPMQKASVILLGGEISDDLHSINGPLTEKCIADMHFNKAFSVIFSDSH